MERSTRTKASALAAVVSALIAFACVPFAGTVSVQETRQLGALVQPPGGPRAIGPMLRANQGSVEVAAETSAVTSTSTTRANGAIGNIFPTASARIRVAAGMFDRVEIGIDSEVSTAGIARTVASDASTNFGYPAWQFRGGVQMRGLFLGTRQAGLGLNLDASLGTIQYAISGTDTVVTIPTRSTPGPTTTVTPFADTGTIVVANARAGLFFQGLPSRDFALLVGALVQTVPRVEGQQSFGSLCTYDGSSYFPTTCTYTPNPLPATYTMQPVGTLWASASYTIGRWTATLLGFVNVLGDPQIVSAVPFGGNLAIRCAF